VTITAVRLTVLAAGSMTGPVGLMGVSTHGSSTGLVGTTSGAVTVTATVVAASTGLAGTTSATTTAAATLTAASVGPVGTLAAAVVVAPSDAMTWTEIEALTWAAFEALTWNDLEGVAPPSLAWQLPVGNAAELAAGVVPSEGKQHIRCLERACWVDTVGVLQGTHDLLIMGHDIGQVVLSDDDGLTWRRPLNDGLHAYPMHSVRADPWNTNRVVALTGRNTTSPASVANFPGFYLTTNQCVSWSPQFTSGDITALGYTGVAWDARVIMDPLASGTNPSVDCQSLIVADPLTVESHDGGTATRQWYAVTDAGALATNSTTNKGTLWGNANFAEGAWTVLYDVSRLGDVHRIVLHPDGDQLFLASQRKGLCRYVISTDTLTEEWHGTGNCTWVELDVDDPDDMWAGFYASHVSHRSSGSWATVATVGSELHSLVSGPTIDHVPGGLGNRVVHVVGELAGSNGTCNRVSDDNGSTWDAWQNVITVEGSRPGYTEGHQVNPHTGYGRILPSFAVRTDAFALLNANGWRTGDFVGHLNDPTYWHFSDEGWTGINMQRGGQAGTVEDITAPARIALCSTDTGLFLSEGAWDSFESIESPPLESIPHPSGPAKNDAKVAFIVPGEDGDMLYVAFGGNTAKLFRTSNRGTSWIESPSVETMGYMDAIFTTPATPILAEMTLYVGRYRSVAGGVPATRAIADDATAEFLAVSDDGTTWRYCPSNNGTRDLWRGTWASPTKLTGWTHSLRPGGTSGLTGRIVFASPKGNSSRFWAPNAGDDLARVTVTGSSTSWEATGLRSTILSAAGLTTAFPLHIGDVVIDPNDPNVVTAVVLEPGVPPLWRTENGEAANPADIVWQNVSAEFPRVGRASLGVLASRGDVLVHGQCGEWLLAPPAARGTASLSLGAAAYQFS